jgi:hypothetical protein
MSIYRNVLDNKNLKGSSLPGFIKIHKVAMILFCNNKVKRPFKRGKLNL